MVKLPKKVTNLAEHATAYLIVEAVMHVAGAVLTTSVFVLVSKILVASVARLANFQWVLMLIFASGGVFLYTALQRRFSKHRPHFPRLNVDFQLVKFEILYRYDDRQKMVYTKRKTLRALQDCLDFYRDKYLWTGTGDVKLHTNIKGHTVQLTVRKSVWQFYEIRFPRTLNKNDEIETEVVWDLEDSGHTAVPFVSATIEEPTQYFQIMLSLNSTLGVTEVVCEESSNIGAKKPFKTFQLSPEGDGNFCWREPDPKLLHHYEMKWSFE